MLSFGYSYDGLCIYIYVCRGILSQLTDDFCVDTVGDGGSL